MEKTILSLVMLLSLAAGVNAQEMNIDNSFSIGIQLNEYQSDFGIGLNFTSPYFADNKVAIRLRGNVMFHQNLLNINETTWSPYFNATIGVVAVSGTLGGFIRLYGEGGLVVLFPSDEFSSEDYNFGGYGLFGFEFHMSDAGAYFIELGAIGTGAQADKIAGNPIYSNGFLISTGYRMYF